MDDALLASNIQYDTLPHKYKTPEAKVVYNLLFLSNILLI